MLGRVKQYGGYGSENGAVQHVATSSTLASLLDTLSHGVDLPGEENVEGVGLFFTSRRNFTARIGFTPVGFRFGRKPSGNGRTGFHRGLKLSQFVEGAFQAAGQICELDLETFVIGIAQSVTMPRVRSRNESLEVCHRHHDPTETLMTTAAQDPSTRAKGVSGG
ncbi:hypothetical protein AB0L53_01500 [Nonomuraea sp. NPDC052129]|uniref:hypothetical protein n=1 Tax=Nonomuraea sp. NPDC052129 TaxID=3154651 RepID=UPI003444A8D9